MNRPDEITLEAVDLYSSALRLAVASQVSSDSAKGVQSLNLAAKWIEDHLAEDIDASLDRQHYRRTLLYIQGALSNYGS